MNYLNKIEENIIGDKISALFLYSKYVYFYHYLNHKEYDNLIMKVIDDYKLNRFQTILKNKYITHNIISLIGVGGYGQIYKLDKQYCIKININKNSEYHEYLIPNKIAEINKELKDMIVSPIALIKKNSLSGLLILIEIHIIFIYLLNCFLLNNSFSSKKLKEILKEYNISVEYKELYRSKHQKIINTYVNQLFAYYLPTLPKINLTNNLLSIIRTIKDKHNNIIKDGFIIIMPLAKSISVKLYLNANLKIIDKQGIKAYRVYPYINRLLFLQIALFILNVKQHFNFCHNDLKPDNILVFPEYKPYHIKYNDLIFYFDELFKFKIADFDFSVIHNIILNNKISKSKLLHNIGWFVDIHFFIHKLFLFLSENELSVDNIFFESLHKTFIYPYCNVPYDRMKENLIVKKDNKEEICREGIYNLEANFDINILEKYIKSTFFNKWINNNIKDNIIVSNVKTVNLCKFSFLQISSNSLSN